jgi:hypothetical protein
MDDGLPDGLGSKPGPRSVIVANIKIFASQETAQKPQVWEGGSTLRFLPSSLSRGLDANEASPSVQRSSQSLEILREAS